MPLALTVIIDNKVRDPELQAFYRQAMALFPLFDLDPLTEAEMEAWFKKREPEIQETLKNRGKNTAILRALTRFTDDVHVENIYDAMVTISISDDEFVREESDLIKSAASIWGYQRPPFKVID
jgi:hypothetical protein